MSTVRALRPRLVRPHLSTRYQCLQRRAESSASTTAKPTATSPNPSFFQRNRSAILWSAFGLTIGVAGGQFVVHTIAPPALPEAGTREDGILLADLNQRIDEEFKVKVLRGKCLAMAKQLKGQEGGWVEVLPLPLDLNENEETKHGLATRLQGAKGFGVERLFWDRSEQKLVAVVWFGGALCGWPGVTHGGAVATALAEKLSLAAALADKGSTDVLAAATPQRLPGTGNHAKMLAPATTPAEPAQLSLGYVKPTYANKFYVIRVAPALPEGWDSDKIVHAEPLGGAEYEATLETLDAMVCAKARARFAPSTALQRKEREIVGGAKNGYAAFKDWMWPSRQKQSQQAG